MDNLQKILFVQKINEEEFETEGLWCIKNGDSYTVDNIPFVAKRVSLGDTVKVEYDKNDKAYYFDDFVSVSGNSTVRLHFEDVGLIETTRKYLVDLGCETEALRQKKIVAVNVPKEISYKAVKDYLDVGEQNGKWIYEESCLVHEYL